MVCWLDPFKDGKKQIRLGQQSELQTISLKLEQKLQRRPARHVEIKGMAMMSVRSMVVVPMVPVSTQHSYAISAKQPQAKKRSAKKNLLSCLFFFFAKSCVPPFGESQLRGLLDVGWSEVRKLGIHGRLSGGLLL